MYLYPPLSLALANGFLLILPMLILRFGLPAWVRKSALVELDHFPPVSGGSERVALQVYFVTNTFLIFSPLLAEIRFGTAFATLGWILYLPGLLLLAAALYQFSQPRQGPTTGGVYRFSRNPIYLGYFLILLGMSCLIGSWVHLAVTVIYQLSVHALILAEERWCRENYGEAYAKYSSKVRRYF